MSIPSSYREAVNAGLLLGVKWTLALVLPILIVVFLLGDYWRVRADATYAAGVIRESLAAQQRALTAQRNSAELAQLRYQNGVANYLEVLDAERNLFDAEQSLVATRRNQLDNLVTLYVALGGGLTE